MKENQIVQAGVGRKFQTPVDLRPISRCSKISKSPTRAAAPCSARWRSRAMPRCADRVEEVAEMIFLERTGSTSPRTWLSHGQKQWLENRHAG